MNLIIGATGQIGSEIVRLLTAGNVGVRALTRDPARATHLPDGVEKHKGDLDDAASLDAAFAGMERAFVMTHAGPHMRGHVKSAVASAKKAGTRHVVLLSSYSVEHLPSSAIGRWHREAEEEVAAAGIGVTLLCPGNFASNSLRWAGAIKSQGAVFDASNGARSAPIDPRDIAAVAAQALVSDGHIGKRYTLTGPALMTAAEQVAILARVLDKPIRYVPVPAAGARAGMINNGMPEHMADAVLELIAGGPERRDLITSTVFDVVGRSPHTYEAWARANAKQLA